MRKLLLKGRSLPPGRGLLSDYAHELSSCTSLLEMGLSTRDILMDAIDEGMDIAIYFSAAQVVTLYPEDCKEVIIDFCHARTGAKAPLTASGSETTKYAGPNDRPMLLANLISYKYSTPYVSFSFPCTAWRCRYPSKSSGRITKKGRKFLDLVRAWRVKPLQQAEPYEKGFFKSSWTDLYHKILNGQFTEFYFNILRNDGTSDVNIGAVVSYPRDAAAMAETLRGTGRKLILGDKLCGL